MIRVIDNAEIITAFVSKKGSKCASLKRADNMFCVNAILAPSTDMGVSTTVKIDDVKVGDLVSGVYDDTRAVSTLYVTKHTKMI